MTTATENAPYPVTLPFRDENGKALAVSKMDTSTPLLLKIENTGKVPAVNLKSEGDILSGESIARDLMGTVVSASGNVTMPNTSFWVGSISAPNGTVDVLSIGGTTITAKGDITSAFPGSIYTNNTLTSTEGNIRGQLYADDRITDKNDRLSLSAGKAIIATNNDFTIDEVQKKNINLWDHVDIKQAQLIVLPTDAKGNPMLPAPKGFDASKVLYMPVAEIQDHPEKVNTAIDARIAQNNAANTASITSVSRCVDEWKS